MSDPRVLLITGTSRGIGFGLSNHYLALGDRVCGCSRAPATIRHPDYTHFELDVASEADVAAMIRTVVRKHGRIDALLNNAGIASMNHALLSPAETARSILPQISTEPSSFAGRPRK